MCLPDELMVNPGIPRLQYAAAEGQRAGDVGVPGLCREIADIEPRLQAFHQLYRLLVGGDEPAPEVTAALQLADHQRHQIPSGMLRELEMDVESDRRVDGLQRLR